MLPTGRKSEGWLVPQGASPSHIQEEEQDWRQLEPRLLETQKDTTVLLRLTSQPSLLTFLLCIWDTSLCQGQGPCRLPLCILAAWSAWDWACQVPSGTSATAAQAPSSQGGGEGRRAFGDSGVFLNCDHFCASDLLLVWGLRSCTLERPELGKQKGFHAPRLHVALRFSCVSFFKKGASLLAQMVENLPAVQKTWVWSWVGKILWRRECLPGPVFLPGEFHGQRSLVGYCPWGRKEWERIEWLSHHFPQKGSLLFVLYHLSRPCSSPSYPGSCFWLDQVPWVLLLSGSYCLKLDPHTIKQQVGEFWMYTHQVNDWASFLCKHCLPGAGLTCHHLSRLCGKACLGGVADLGTKTACAPPGFKPISTVWITSHEPHVCFGGYKINGWNNCSRCYLLKKNFM